jgi:hypothetical protein
MKGNGSILTHEPTKISRNMDFLTLNSTLKYEIIAFWLYILQLKSYVCLSFKTKNYAFY